MNKWDYTTGEDAVVVEEVRNYGSDDPDPIRVICVFPIKRDEDVDQAERLAEAICKDHNRDIAENTSA